MSITDVRLKEVDGSIDAEGQREYTVTYHVDTDDINDGPITARNASGIPVRGSSFNFGNDFDIGAILRQKNASLLHVDETYKMWAVVCRYTTQPANIDDGPSPENGYDSPLDEPVKWSGSFIQFTRDYLRDRDDNAIKNSAGDPFLDPPIIGDDSRLSIVAERNLRFLNVNVWADFADAVNNGTWWGLDAETLKVQSITWDLLYHNNVPYFPVRYEFHIKADKWSMKPLDAGYFEKKAGAEPRKREHIKDKGGVNIDTPWPLKLTDPDKGRALTDAEITDGLEEYHEFFIYNARDFSQLGLPAVLGSPF